VRIAGVTNAVYSSGRSYFTVDNITADHVNYYVNAHSSDHVWISNSTFTGLVETGWPDGVVFSENSHHNWIHDCSIGNIGYALQSGSPTAIGGMFLGDWEIPNDASNYNLIENNVLYHGGHHVLEINSAYNVIRNNYFHNENWTGTCAHPETNGLCGDRDIIIEDNTGSWASWNVIENNRIAYSGTPADGITSTGLSIRTQSNIVRNNVFYNNDGSGIEFITISGQPYDVRFNHVYGNDVYHNGYTIIPMTGADVRNNYGLLFEYDSGNAITSISVKNNAFWSNNGGAMYFYHVNRSDQIVAGNWEEAGDPLFVSTGGTPNPADPNEYDFHLQPGSPLRSAGVYLTVTTSAGSGTTISVADAAYFTDGYGIVPGDTIQLQGQTQSAHVARVDYAANTLTVDAPLSWSAGQGVSLAYSGTAPNIGAY
jgi:hypothetical protein